MPQSDRTFRIFVSSTFNDFRAERNALQERVFPRLRDLCSANGARFQPIDLRWGVSEEAGLDQRTVEICLSEIARSQRVSPRPNFIVLLGNRYGWRPLPLRIPAAELDALLAAMSMEARARVQFWYRRDDNAVPPVYLLRPREAEYRDRTRWSQLELGLRQDLSAAAVRLGLSGNARDRYQSSATEQEIALGVLGGEAPEQHVFCHFRQIENPPPTQADFLDLDAHGEVDTDAAAQLERVKAMLRLRLGANVHDYRAAWTATGAAEDYLGSFCDDVYDDLSRTILGELAETSNLDVLSAEVAAHARFGAERAQGFLGRAGELACIIKYAAEDDGISRQPLLIVGDPGSGKSALMAQAARRAAELAPKSFVVQRFLGATASSADPASLLRGLCEEIYRLCGLEQVKQRRLAATDKDRDYERDAIEREFAIDGNVAALAGTFRRFLAMIPAGGRMVIFLEALDQLDTGPGSDSAAWLPTRLPDAARLIVSSTPGAQASAIRHSLERTDALVLGSMTIEESDALLDDWLTAGGRRLQPSQRAVVTAAFQGRRLPLLLKLVFETVRLWTSFDQPEALATEVPMLFRAFLQRLADDSAHGERLVSRALGFLAAARHGLAEDEMLDLLSPEGDPTVMAEFRRRSPLAPQTDRFPVAVWSRFYFDIEPYLSARRADGATLLRFYHRTLLDVVNDDYLSGEAGQDIRERIAAYFQRQPLRAANEVNARKLSEEPYLLTHAGQWPALFSCLTDLRRLELLASRRDESSGSAAGVGQIEADLAIALELWPVAAGGAEREALAHIAAAVDHHGDLFARRPSLLAAQLYNQLRARTELLASTFEDQARHWHQHAWLRTKQPLPQPSLPGAPAAVRHSKPATHCLFRDGGRAISAGADGALRLWNPHDGRCVAELAGHQGAVTAIAAGPDSTDVVSSGEDFVLRVWNLTAATERLILRGHQGAVLACAVSPAGDMIASGGADREVRVWDRQTGASVAAMRGHTDAVTACAFAPGGTWLATGGGDADGTVRLWDLQSRSARLVLGEGAAAVFDGLNNQSATYGMAVAMGAMSAEEAAALAASLPQPEGHESGVEACVASPDGSWLASIACEEEAIFWSVATGHEAPPVARKRTGYDSTRSVTPSAFSRSKLTLSRDGSTVAWIGYAKRAHIRDTRREGDEVKMLASDATAVSVSPAGTLIAVGQRSGLILVYDTVSRVERAALALSGEIMGIDWHPSLPLLACVDAAGYCYLVEVFIP